MVEKRPGRVLAIDGDALGWSGGSMTALIVLVLCFYWTETGVITALLRAGWACVCAYAFVYALARYFLRELRRQNRVDRGPQHEEKKRNEIRAVTGAPNAAVTEPATG